MAPTQSESISQHSLKKIGLRTGPKFPVFQRLSALEGMARNKVPDARFTAIQPQLIEQILQCREVSFYFHVRFLDQTRKYITINIYCFITN